MDPKRWHAFLPALLLGVSTLLVAFACLMLAILMRRKQLREQAGE